MPTNERIRCVIIEDEPLAQELLTDHIERLDNLHLVGTAYNAAQARVLVEEQKPDLLLLDIHLPKLNGFDFLAQLPPPRPAVIVTSAYREFALKGYDFAIADFLEKPIFFDRFSQAIQRAEERLGRVSLPGPQPIEEGQVLHWDSQSSHVLINANHQRHRVEFADIPYIESMDNYSKIHRLSQPTRPVLPKVALTAIALTMPPMFIRVHRKYIINSSQIDLVKPGEIQLKNGTLLPIGPTFSDDVRNRLGS